MRRVAADAIRNPPDLALIAHVPAATLRRAIPIILEKLGPFTEPEPSEGATIELASGRHVGVIYGLTTERLYVHAAKPDGVAAVADFLRESKIGEASIEWLDPRFRRPQPLLRFSFLRGEPDTALRIALPFRA